ncbi:MAG: cysteine hydrolase [Angelakisella sp.]|nr:cysteine hydrolase [Angelakisella sp.]
MGKVLVVVDYQKDFVDGALGFAGAKELEAGLLALVEEYIQNNWPVVFTLDTHGPDYLSTREGKHLPLPHCRKSTEGWRLYGRLERFMEEDHPHVYLAPKFAFGAQNYSYLAPYQPTEITLTGLVTNLCVMANAVILQTAFPNAEVIIQSRLCASFDPILHGKALDVMEGMQMKVLR